MNMSAKENEREFKYRRCLYLTHEYNLYQNFRNGILKKHYLLEVTRENKDTCKTNYEK